LPFLKSRHLTDTAVSSTIRIFTGPVAGLLAIAVLQVMECSTVRALGTTARTLPQAAFVLLSIVWCLLLWLVVIAGNVRSVF